VRRGVLALALLACSREPAPSRVPPPVATAPAPGSPRSCLAHPVGSEPAVRCWVEWLAAPALAGRAPGTPGGETARAGIEAVLRDLSLDPAGDRDTYTQALPRGASVLAQVVGRDPARSDEVVVVGAHYDHLGGEHLGADDNASGVAVLLELARALAKDPPARSVLIAAFDAEEPPAYRTPAMGSQRWVDFPTLPRAQVVAMLAMDLMGGNLWPGERTPLYVMGRETLVADGAPPLAGDGLTVEAMHLRLVEDLPSGRQAFSDHGAFFAAKIPVLFFSTGRSPHYHRITDTPDTLDHPKLAAEVAVVEAHLRWLADLPARPAWRADPPVLAADAAALARMLAAGARGSAELRGLASEVVRADLARMRALSAVAPETPLDEAAAREVIAASLRAQCLLVPDDEVPTAACLVL
jgi:hypothetical protein